LEASEGTRLGTAIKYLRQITSAAAGIGLGAAIKYLGNQNTGAGRNLDLCR
jgi:hypothetical protein